MIRVYKSDAKDFNNNGLGILKDFKSSPRIKESLNGIFELNFDYALNGQNVEYLVVDNIIKAPYDDSEQLFRIKKVRPSLKKITVYAVHIFYDLADNFLVDVSPTKKNGVSAIQWLLENAMYQTNFSVTGDVTKVESARYVRKNIVDAILGTDNCVVKRWGGEIERNNFNIIFHNVRGADRGVFIKYGKNIKEIGIAIDFTNVVTRVVPQGANELLLPEYYVDSPLISTYRNPIIKKYEFSNITIDENTSEDQALENLRQAANDLFLKDNIDKPAISVNVDWLELSKTEEYKNKYSNFEYVKLGDTVTVEALGYKYKIRVITVEYDCLLERYVSFEIGDPKADYIDKQTEKITSEISKNNSSVLQKAKEAATTLINNGFGGCVRVYPDRIFILDTNNEATAKNVWQWNLNGFGFSKNGIDGPYETAITQDGKIVADFITTGKLNTDVIEGYDSLTLSLKKLIQDYELNMTTSMIASGNPVIIEDAGEYELESIEIDGKSFQGTTNGYQLFDSSLIDSTMQVDNQSNGVALINNYDGSFTISKEGTGILSSAFSTYTNYSHEKTIEMLKPGNIYIKYDEKTKPYVLLQLRAENTIFFEVNNYSDNHASGNVTQEMLDNPSTILRIGFFCPKNATVTPTTIWPMFYQDGNGDWEKFTGGKPMPNLDFKSEIKTVKGINNLCNIVSVSPKSYSNGLPAGNVQALKIESFDSNNINFNITGNGNYIALTNIFDLEPSTNYILSYERLDIVANANSRWYIYSIDNNDEYSIISNALSGGAGKKEITFKTTDTGKIALGFGFASNASGSKSEIKKIKIEKGNKSHDYVPYGSWLLAKTHNKNFFNKNNIVESFRIGLDGNLTSSGIYCVSEYIEVISKQKYVFNKTRTALYNRIAFYNKDYEIIGVESTANNVITTPENTKYLRFGWLKDDIESLQLEEGDSSTDYEEFKENEALIDLNIYDENNNIVNHHELAEINNINDTYKDGILTKRIKKVILDGTENWSLNTSASTVNGYYEFSTTIADKPSKQVLLMCDGLEVGNAYNNSKEQIRNRTDEQIYINIKGERLETQDVAGFKKYLSENNITVYYEINPKTYELTYENLKLFKDYNFITLNDELYLNMSIKYLTDSVFNAQYVTHAEHKMTADSITSSLNKKVSIDNFNSTIEEVNNTIEQKIDDSETSINLEVSKKIKTAKTEAINSANNSTDNKLKNYSDTNQINAQLKLKIGKDENDQVTSMLNASAMEINISGNRFILEADNISIDKYGNLICQNAKIRGGDLILNDDGTSENAALKIKNGDTNRYTYYTATGILADLTCDYNFTMDDIKNIQNYILEKGDLSKDQFEMYDLNKDGVVDGKDMLRVQAYILSGISKTKPGKFILNTDSFRDNLQIIDGSGNSIVSIGLNGIYENGKKFKKEHGQQTLWNGSYYMHGSQEITLSENISDQENGIVLVFSHFNNSSLNADDYWFEMKFIPKSFVKDFPGCGVDFMFTNATFGTVGSKYLYITDNKIKGHADNQKTGTGTSGIKYDNSQWVLRKVIGV